jgi:hypothetical protein
MTFEEMPIGAQNAYNTAALEFEFTIATKVIAEIVVDQRYVVTGNDEFANPMTVALDSYVVSESPYRVRATWD